MKNTLKINKLNIIYHIVYSAFMAGLVFVVTFFIQIPYGNGVGYFNLSDALILFATGFFGPVEGLISGMIGATLADIFSGYASFAPFTLIAKGLESLSFYLIMYFFKKVNFIKYIALFIAPLFMVLTYFISYIALFGYEYAIVSSPFDILQGEIGAVFAFVLLATLKRAHPKFASKLYIKDSLI